MFEPEDYAQEALDISETMLIQAEQQQWQELTQLETKRSGILEKLFQHPSMPQSLARVASLLRQIIELDQMTIACGNDARSALKTELQLLTQGK
ncbi:MAG: flagellar protein FliT, partial [Gammaproteobacteria bacterium]|nr:flagellar protein FliT [Gammaproteobacteria bacterium]